MKLHYQVIGSGQPLVIIHGLFGSSDNWRAMAKQLSAYAKVITVDLRNHGLSPHSEQQNYPLMVEDLVELFDDLGLEKANIIGHSVGGKVAMAFAASYPERLAKLIVVDISPRRYIDTQKKIFKLLMDLDLSLYSRRRDVDEVLVDGLPDRAVRQFLLMNIISKEGELNWRINLTALNDNYHHLLAPVCEQKNIDVESCFIRGGQAQFIQIEDEQLIARQFHNSEVYTIEQAGHWVHAEAPQEFLAKVVEFLDYD